MPPSPPLSARITKVMYLMLMMMIERPEDQREQPVDVGGVDRQLVAVTGEGLAEGVQRAGPDVAVHDAQGDERQAADAGRAVAAVSPDPSDPSTRRCSSGRAAGATGAAALVRRGLSVDVHDGVDQPNISPLRNTVTGPSSLTTMTVASRIVEAVPTSRRVSHAPVSLDVTSPPRHSGPAGPPAPQRAG